jgi:hypothetical protein
MFWPLRAQEFAFFFANLGEAVVGQALRLPGQEWWQAQRLPYNAKIALDSKKEPV